MFNSLSPDQQSELRSMFAGMMENMELNFSLNRLVSNLRMATPTSTGAAHTGCVATMAHPSPTDLRRRATGPIEGSGEFLGQANAAQDCRRSTWSRSSQPR